VSALNYSHSPQGFSLGISELSQLENHFNGFFIFPVAKWRCGMALFKPLKWFPKLKNSHPQAKALG